MSRLVLNRDGGMTDEFGHMLGLSRMTSGDVVEGLAVVQKSSPTMDILVQYGVAKIQYGTLGTRYDYWVCNDADATVTIPTADSSSPRIDIILAVVDRTVTPSSTIANNNNNMLKFVVASGTPSGVAADPSASQIQAAAGTGNPYIKLARIYVDAGRTQITSAQIVNDLRNFARVTTTTAINFADATGDFIANGTGILSSTSGLTGGLSDITYYIAATRYVKTNIPAKTYTASKDTYVYIDTSGNITYTTNTNGATAPTTPSGSILVGMVTTNATAITSISLRSRGAIKANNIDWSSVGGLTTLVAGTESSSSDRGGTSPEQTNQASVTLTLTSQSRVIIEAVTFMQISGSGLNDMAAQIRNVTSGTMVGTVGALTGVSQYASGTISCAYVDTLPAGTYTFQAWTSISRTTPYYVTTPKKGYIKATVFPNV